MYKVKTHSGAKKRFRKGKNGLIKASRPFRRHLLTKKSAKRKRGLRSPMYIAQVNVHHVAPLIPYK